MPSYKNKSVDNYIDRLKVLVSFSFYLHMSFIHQFQCHSNSNTHLSCLKRKPHFKFNDLKEKNQILHTKPCWEALYFGLFFREVFWAKMRRLDQPALQRKFVSVSHVLLNRKLTALNMMVFQRSGPLLVIHGVATPLNGLYKLVTREL